MFSLRRHEHSPQGTLREVRVYPLTFSEFSDGRREPLSVLWKEYCTFADAAADKARQWLGIKG